MRVLLVGALRAETTPVLPWLERPRPSGRRLVFGRRGALEIGLLTCGPGPEPAARRTAAALAEWDAERVISFGTCGALVDDLDVGDVVAVSALADSDGPFRPLAPTPGWRAVACVTVDRVVDDAIRRSALAARGAQIVEMEAAAVQRAAGERSFLALKVVSDPAGAGVSEPPSGARRALMITRFQKLAARLVARDLAPALFRALEG